MKAEVERFGLCTRRPADRIALRGVRVRARLSGMSQRTTVEQTYVNLERQAVEAVYTFPLPESAAVCGFEVITGDRVLTGTVEEIERAVEKYEEAVSEGHGAFMVEENRPDVFTVRVGNLKPGQAATIRLTYVCALERMDNSIRLSFPTTIAPRYVSHGGTDPLTAMIDGDALNPPHVLSVPYGITIEVEVDLGRPLKGITSPSHAIRVSETEGAPGRARVTFAGRYSEMNRDVVIEIALRKEHEPVVQAATGPGGASYLAVTFVPEFDVEELVEPRPQETVFVLDCSGSMQGQSIQQATAALELCLRSLSVGDTFNICRFGSRFELMASEPLHYSQETLGRALAYVRKGADLGGTELYDALRAVVTPKPAVGEQRQVILLTDGQVSNEPACVDLARKMRGRNRIFSFGIGAAASSTLVKGLARATGGAAEFIAPGERIDDKVLRTFARLNSPMAGDVAIDWDGCDVQTLAELPPVFDGDVMTVFGRAPGKLPRTVTLSCRTPAGPKQWRVAVPAAADDGGVIATMWARRTIQSLEEVNSLYDNRYGVSRNTREGRTVVSISKEFGLLSTLTTFIAIEHRSLEERNEGRPALRRVPVMLAQGWGGVEMGAAGRTIGELTAMPALSGLLDKTLDRCVDRSIETERETELREARQRGLKFRSFPKARFHAGGAAMAGGSSSHAPSSPTPAAAPEAAGLYQVLSTQGASGAFEPTHLVWDVLRADGRNTGHWPQEIERTAPAMAGGLLDRDAVVRTAVALLLLRTHFADRKSLWRRAAAKAVAFLAHAFGCPTANVEAWLKDLEARLLTP